MAPASLAFLLFLISAGTAAGQMVLLPGRTPAESQRDKFVERTVKLLVELKAAEVTDAGRSKDRPLQGGAQRRWRWIVLNEIEWQREAQRFRVKTPWTFSNLAMRATYLRGFKLAALGDGDLRRLLAHELGHVVCWCADEKRAEAEAAKLLKD